MDTQQVPQTALPKDVAEALHMSEQALAQMRYRGTGPRWVRAGSRRVLYRWSDVQEWLEQNTIQRTDDRRGVATP